MKERAEILHILVNTREQSERAEDIQAAGYAHGKEGFYPDADFSSDADWCYGVGARIQELETELDIDDGSIFDLYSEAHSEGLAEFRRENTIATWYECDDVETWEDDNGVTHESHSALVFISCPGMSGAELVEEHRSIMGESLELTDCGADDCYAIVPVNTADGQCDKTWCSEIAKELGISTTNLCYGG